MAKLFSIKKTSISLITVILSLLLIAPKEAISQTAVTPPGAGTQISPYLISELGHLVWMSNNAADSGGKYYTMTANIDASATATWNDAETDTSILEGFKPIGTYSSPDTTSFRGIFDGGDHTITSLVINRPKTECIGLFGCVGLGGGVRNLGLTGAVVNGSSSVGSLVGGNGGTVSNVSVAATVTAWRSVGGLIGSNGGAVSNACASCAVMKREGDHPYDTALAMTRFGGLIGGNYGTISNANASGTVTGECDVGGLIGENGLGGISSTVSDSFATSVVTGHSWVGGLIGSNHSGTISNVYATGAVTGEGGYVGGLIGEIYRGIASNAYATGTVRGEYNVGGLVGSNLYGYGVIWNVYSAGAVSGNSCVGGLVGYNSNPASAVYAYWDIGTSGQNSSAGGIGKSTAEMKQQATFVDWDFSNVWIINEDVTYPRLRSLLLPSDANLDGMVDVGDLGILAANYGKTSGATWGQGDFNGDGVVDVGDLGILAAHYGEGVSGAFDFDADCASVFGESANKEAAESDSDISLCSSFGLPIVALLTLTGLMLVRLED